MNLSLTVTVTVTVTATVTVTDTVIDTGIITVIIIIMRVTVGSGSIIIIGISMRCNIMGWHILRVAGSYPGVIQAPRSPHLLRLAVDLSEAMRGERAEV